VANWAVPASAAATGRDMGAAPAASGQDLNVAATLSYGVPQQAQLAAQGVHFLDGWLKVLGPLLGGLRLRNLEVMTDNDDLRCKFALDADALSGLIALAPRLLPNTP